jgi:hypothetical protein
MPQLFFMVRNSGDPNRLVYAESLDVPALYGVSKLIIIKNNCLELLSGLSLRLLLRRS